jgi:hypothetical protein
MPSSTSHSKRIPRLAAVLLLAALVCWLTSAAYTLRLNPEVRHFVHSDVVKKRWADQMTREHGSKIVVYGGSSCEFAIDGERMLERSGLACVNAGRGAGMGIPVLTMAALRDCRPKDTLVVAIEPVLLTEPLDIPNLGIQFSIAAGHFEWIQEPLAPAASISLIEAGLALRPGGYHTFTLLGKILQRRPFYRYQPEDLRLSGWIQTLVRVPISGPPRHPVVIPADHLHFLRSLRDWCQDHQVRLAYSIPWGYTPANEVDAFRQENARFLLQISDIVPVLRDPRLGAHSISDHFSDSVWHLTEEGAALRTDELARQLQDWDVWSRPALEQFASNPQP